MLLLLWVSVAALGYIYVGYPMILRIIVAIRGARPIARRDITPTVSLVISAYNEAAVLPAKLTNALGLDYPRGQLEIVVVSDASDDGTDALVEQLAPSVRLIRQPVRRGKTAGLNLAVPQVRGEIVVFSDANALYQSDALRKLVRNFADPAVGCVTGEARYTKGGAETASQVGERAYWDYEILQKRLETAIGSMVGGDGAIYAIRRHLWRTLPETAINDFLNPLQIVAAGWRGVYEPEAICFEETAGATRREYRRRVRIVSRSWRAVFQAPGVLNPFKTGLFAFSILSHKILRWWSGVFVMIIALVAATWSFRLMQGMSGRALMLLAAGSSAALLVPPVQRVVSILGYFLAINVASVAGALKGTFGSVSATWRPPRLEVDHPNRAEHEAGWLLMLMAASVVLTVAALSSPPAVVAVVFWASLVALTFIYCLYPLIIGAVALVIRRPIVKARIEPSVALLIVANDEAEVIDAKLQNALNADYPRGRFRIIVASDGSVDGTNEIVRSYERNGVELLAFRDRKGKMSAINAAMAATEGVDVVVFSDANVFLQPAAVRQLVDNLADPRVGAVSGDVVLVGDRAALGWSEDLYYQYERWLQKTESAIGSMVGVDGALYAIRKSLFAPQPADTILDDMAIPMAVLKQGYRVVFEPAAIAVEQGSQSAWEEFLRKSRVLAGAAQFLLRGTTQLPWRKPQVLLSFIAHKGLRWLSPALAITTFACAVALSPTSKVYFAAALVQGGLLALGTAGCIPGLRRISPIGFAHYYCLVQAAAAVGFVRGLSGRQPATWQRFARASADAQVAGARTGGVA